MLRDYSHQEARRGARSRHVTPRRALILDGCIFSHRAFRDLVDEHCLLVPADIATWHGNCVFRDVLERHFDREFSTRHTWAKLADMSTLLSDIMATRPAVFACSGDLTRPGGSLDYARRTFFDLAELAEAGGEAR